METSISTLRSVEVLPVPGGRRRCLTEALVVAGRVS